MSKQQRNNSSAKQETQLKNRRTGVIAGVLLLAFIIIGTFSLREKPAEKIEDASQNIEASPEEVDVVLQTEDSEVAAPALEEPLSSEASPAETESVPQVIKRPTAKPKQVASSIQSSVQWAGLEASIEAGEAQVKWKTQYEQHTAYFEIERSIDEENFKPIGKMSGSEMQDVEENVYVFSDSSLKYVGMPRIYYRIKQVGLDNKTHSSEIYEYDLGLDLDLYIRVEEIKDGIITVAYAGDEEGKAKVGVLTSSGKSIYEEEVEVGFSPQRRRMDASLWGEGVYLLVLYDQRTRVSEILEITH